MLKTSQYVTFCLAFLALGVSGCGATCPPAVTPNTMTKAADAGTNAGVNEAATPRAKVQPTEAERQEAADLRIRSQADVDAGRLREALPNLERSFSLSGDVTILGDLGLALDAVGRLDESWLALYRFRVEASAVYEPVRAKIDAKLAELENQLGGLMIDSDTPGAELIVRRQVVAKLPLATPIFFAPGDVSVIVRAPGKPRFTVRSRVAIGSVTHASANLAALAGGAMGAVGGTLGDGGALTPPVPPSPPILPIVLVGGGAVVIGGALAAGIIYSGKAEQFDLNHCGKADAKPICKSLDSDANISMLKVSGGLLGSALVTGIVAYIIMRPKAPDLDCPKVGKAAPLPVRCGVGADGNGAGIGCVGSF